MQRVLCRHASRAPTVSSSFVCTYVPVSAISAITSCTRSRHSASVSVECSL